MTAWLVALVSPEGDVEAWLTADRQVTPALPDAVRFASRAEADAVARAQNRHDRRMPHRDGRRWVVQGELVEVAS